MKCCSLCLPLILLSLIVAVPVKAQPTLKPPKWMSHKGYWVVESNIKNPKSSIVYYYTNNHELLYKESVTGRRIDVSKKRVCKRLESVLVQWVAARQKEQSLLSKQ